MTGHGGQPFQGVVRFFLFAVLGAVDDCGLLRGVVHSFLGEGGPNQIRRQVFQGLLLPRLDAAAGKDVEAGVPPTVEHVDEFRGDFPLAQEHGEHLHAEELLQVLHVEFGCDPKSPLTIKTPIGGHYVQMGVKTFRKVSEGLCGNNRSRDCLGLGRRGLQEGLQTFPGAAAKIRQEPAIIEEKAAEDFGDGKNPMPVRNGPEHMPAKPLAELHGPFLSTAWAELSLLTTEREDPFRAAGVATNAGKPPV